MFFPHLFQSFIPRENPLGFGGADFIVLALTAILVLFALIWRPWVIAHVAKLEKRALLCAIILAALPVVLRMALLPGHPAPRPQVYDEFAHLLTADTLRHFRLANPPHPLHRFFETFYVIQQPSYSSIYPIGQGLALAVGRVLFGRPWAGVVLSVAAFCGLCYWMLRGWTTPRWALVGGVLAVIEFGPLNEWMNDYWGGAVSAVAGCLVFGALPRLRAQARRRDAVLLGLGLGVQLLTRPFESVLLVLCVILFFLPALRNRDSARRLLRAVPIIALSAAPAILLTLAQNRQVTGSSMTLPYMLSRYQYGVPTTFTIQPNPVPHNQLTPQQALAYRSQSSYHGAGTDTVNRYFGRLEYRARFYRFFFLTPLYLALPFFLLALREFRYAWVAMTLAIFALGSNFYPFFFPHYIAAVTCLFVLVSIVGLERLNRLSRAAARLILLLSIAQFLFWYGLHLAGDPDFSLEVRRYETWDWINHQGGDRRSSVVDALNEVPGDHLVFVRYYPQHIFQDEWVYNEAEIDRAHIVWARDLGAQEDQKLIEYYPARTTWLLEPDFRPPRLTRYEP